MSQLARFEPPSLQGQAVSDAHLVDLWLHGRPPHTQRAYRADVARFLAFVAKPLPTVTLGDLQAFADSLAGLAPSSRARTLAAVKSLLSFGQRTGYLPVNVGAAVKLPPRKNTLAERILTEPEIVRLLASGAEPPQPGPAAADLHRRPAARLGDRRPHLTRPPAAHRRRPGDRLWQGREDARRLLQSAIWRELLRERARAEEQARRQAAEKERGELWKYLPGGTLWDGWEVGPECQEGTGNAWALYPRLAGQAASPYIRLKIAGDVLWLQASTGGPTEYIPAGWPVEKVRQMLAWVLAPALDPQLKLPTAADLEEPDRLMSPRPLPPG